MTEAELAQYFVEYLSDFDLYFEAPPGNVDIVALSGKKRIAIEVKTSLNFKVIEQAYHNTKYFHLSYIAIPKPKRRTFGYKICEDYGIGILTYNTHYCRGERVDEDVKPRFNSIDKFMLKHGRYHDYMKRSKPGVPGNTGEVVTPFKITVENLANYVKRHPGCSLKEAIKGIDHHYGSFSGAKSSIDQWIGNGVINCVKLEKGKLYINSLNQNIDQEDDN